MTDMARSQNCVDSVFVSPPVINGSSLCKYITCIFKDSQDI